jgi:hypothetical protein
MRCTSVVASVLLGVVLAMNGLVRGAEEAGFRPPAVPLVTHDPYFSAWSFSSELNGDWPRHWTGAVHAMCGMLRIDGKAYRWMGAAPKEAAAMKQKSVRVFPTRTVYEFEQDGIALTATFFTPALPHDLDVLSRPITYVVMSVRSTDGKEHQIEGYFDATAEWAVDKTEQQVTWSRETAGDLTLLRVGTTEQPVLAKKGDNLRIDWGHLYVGFRDDDGDVVNAAITSDEAARGAFVARGRTADKDDDQKPRRVNDRWPVLSISGTIGQVGEQPQRGIVMIGYDDEYSVEYMGKKLRPWWRRNGGDIKAAFRAAAADVRGLYEKCVAFDEELMADCRTVGGEKYERIASLSYRQAIAAHKLVDDGNGTPLFLSKENFSNGCIATVDVTYPSAPLFLLTNPTLLKGMTTPILDYAQSSGRWTFPFAPHDLGQYPKANGQVYGGGEKTEKDQMPVEECGNMLILVNLLTHTDGNADYAKKYWPTLTKWAEYLKEKGLDPENQLCTDDFAGHLAHNTNLSVKAIVALGCYAQLCDKLGKQQEAFEYHAVAKKMADKWQEMAADGDHYRLTFDKSGTWSQKYNLVWDKLLGLRLFPAEVAKKEVAYYLTKQNKYGLPLDNRKRYTKLDWIVWSATLADRPEDFRALVDPIYLFAHETPDRVPLSDWFDTVSGRKVGFQARSVVGGVFIPLLKDPEVWRKWSSRASAK